jgi:hypothetical protein
MKISFFGPNLLAAFSMCFFPSQTMKWWPLPKYLVTWLILCMVS